MKLIRCRGLSSCRECEQHSLIMFLFSYLCSWSHYNIWQLRLILKYVFFSVFHYENRQSEGSIDIHFYRTMSIIFVKADFM